MKQVRKPFLILKEDSKRSESEEAVKVNIEAASIIGESIKNMLVPKEMETLKYAKEASSMILNIDAVLTSKFIAPKRRISAPLLNSIQSTPNPYNLI